MRLRAALLIAVATALLAGVVATAAEWSLPATTLSSSEAMATSPTVVVDGSGIATALWAPDVGGGTAGAIKAARFSNGEWGAPRNASTGEGAVTYPVAVVDSAGVVTAAWTEVQGPDRIVQAARCTGGAWSTPVNLSAAGGDGGGPALVVDKLGTVTAMWGRTAGVSTVIQYARFTDGAWGSAQDVASAGGIGTGAQPQLAADSAGVVTAIWRSRAGAEITMRAARYTSGAWSSPQTLSPASGTDTAWYPGVVAAPSGDVTAVWAQATPGFFEVQYSRYTGGAWSGPATIAGSASGGTAYPEPVVDASGVVTVAWYQTAIGGSEVRASRYEGGSWTSPALVSALGQEAELPRLTADASGQVIAAWEDKDGESRRISTARYENGAWSSPQTVSAVEGASRAARLAADAKGNVTIVWERDPDGSSLIVQAAQYFTVPSPPRKATASAGNASAEVSWDVPATNAGSPITGYTVTAAPGGSACTATPPVTRCTVTGLTNGTAHTFSVTASNALGTSWASTTTATPVAPAGGGTAALPLTATITTSRGTVTSGMRFTAGIRVRNTGTATATKVVACIKVPRNLAIVAKPRAKRPRNPACFRVKSLKVGKQVTRKVTLLATTTKKVRRSVTGTARAQGIAKVKAKPRRVTVKPAA